MLDTSYQRDPRFVVRTVGSHTMLMQVEGTLPSDVHALLLDGPVALCLWEELAVAVSGSHLVECVTAEFDVPSDVAERDVSTFLEQLLAAGCVRPA
jgi:hypothetical protein